MQEDRAFIEAIVHGAKPPVTALDGLRSVELVTAVYESISTGATIAF